MQITSEIISKRSALLKDELRGASKEQQLEILLSTKQLLNKQLDKLDQRMQEAQDAFNYAEYAFEGLERRIEDLQEQE